MIYVCVHLQVVVFHGLDDIVAENGLEICYRGIHDEIKIDKEKYIDEEVYRLRNSLRVVKKLEDIRR